MTKPMTQSQIDSLLKDSDSQYQQSRQSELESRVKIETNQEKVQTQKIQQSNQYGDSFEDFQQSKRTEGLNANNFKKQSQANIADRSSVYDSYNNQEFQSYEQSRRTKQFQRSQPQAKRLVKKPQSKQLKPIQQQSNKKSPSTSGHQKGPALSQASNTGGFIKKKPSNVILTSEQAAFRTKSKQKQQVKQNRYNNNPYNYNRLQQRQKQLLLTTLTEQNKKLKHVLTQRDKQLSSIKVKYNILFQQKSQVYSNAKQATLNKKLQTLQTKYDALLKQRAKDRAYKTVMSQNQMSKTMNNNFVSQVQAEQREQQLLIIVQKLKERLVSTDKQLKTLQHKMNQGLDYQDQLKRKLTRVQQLQFRLDKMKCQAEDDRTLIQALKEKTQQQKKRIEQLQQQKNQLHICLKRAQMTEATQNDLAQELQQARRQKQVLQTSLRQISLNFTKNIGRNPPKQQDFDNIEDSNELLNYQKEQKNYQKVIYAKPK